MKRSLFLIVLMGQCLLITCHLHEYIYIKKEMTWHEAQSYCRESHTDLATVSNMTDMERLLAERTTDTEDEEDTEEAWIGLHKEKNGNWQWYWSLPGVEFNETQIKWGEGEPNGVGTENCAFMMPNLTFGDLSCEKDKDKGFFLCYNETNASKKFHLIKERMSWLRAQKYCRENHTDLVSGPDQLQDKQLRSEIGFEKTFLLIGLFREAWRWSDGSSFSFRHWNLDFDDEDKSEQCASTALDDEHRWDTDDCGDRKPFFCYDDKVILINKSMTWVEALYYCREKYRDLVTITNLDEQRWVQDRAKKANTPYVWLGLRYTCTLDFWFWVSDEVVKYDNWVSDGKTDDCDMSGAMDTGGEHKWFKTLDNQEFNFICSKV